MVYFKNARNVTLVENEQAWHSVLSQMRNHTLFASIKPMQQVVHPLEPKALHIFTFARRFLISVDELVSNRAGKWHFRFVETSVLLYPIIEMIGLAVMDKSATEYKESMRYSSKRIGAGLYWLNSPTQLPDFKSGSEVSGDKTPMNTVHKYMLQDRAVPKIATLFALRHFYLHGLGHSEKQEENLIDYALPKGIAGAIEAGLYKYWDSQRLTFIHLRYQVPMVQKQA